MIIPPIDWSQSINPTPVPHGTPRCKWIKNFELAQFNISQVRTEELGGFIYLNRDPNALSPRDLYPGVDEEIRRVFPDLADMRLIRAHNPLQQTQMSVAQVAACSGFGSLEHFSRTYRARFGCPPSEDRRQAWSAPVMRQPLGKAP